MLIRNIKPGDEIHCYSFDDLRMMARRLTQDGYEVEIRGWQGLRSNTLTITKIPGAEVATDGAEILQHNGNIRAVQAQTAGSV